MHKQTLYHSCKTLLRYLGRDVIKTILWQNKDLSAYICISESTAHRTLCAYKAVLMCQEWEMHFHNFLYGFQCLEAGFSFRPEREKRHTGVHKRQPVFKFHSFSTLQMNSKRFMQNTCVLAQSRYWYSTATSKTVALATAGPEGCVHMSLTG